MGTIREAICIIGNIGTNSRISKGLRRRWSGDLRQMRRFAAEKRKLETETFVVVSFLVDGGDEQRRQSMSTAWFELAVDDGHDGARQR
ncbi:hypothetical protein F2Q69_00024970 [Brassica cretica]|uniref:Uncharacterized protein n=1 Tax=Brassica cretica TaxID=69181 RepID=A0A8S9QBP5_BRACR|nr:hypothetical protein F2Q69_00024970 [Brassica cretica]